MLVFKGFNQNQSSPEGVVKQVAQNLEKRDGEGDFHLEETSSKLLQQNNAWAMLITNDGQVQWDYHL